MGLGNNKLLCLLHVEKEVRTVVYVLFCQGVFVRCGIWESYHKFVFPFCYHA